MNGLESLTNLRRLDLSNNSIENVSGLETLSKLEILNLENNNIKVIEGFDNLRSLKQLYLFSNQISQINSFNVSQTLTRVSLSGNPIYNEVRYLPGKTTVEKLKNYSHASTEKRAELVQEGKYEMNRRRVQDKKDKNRFNLCVFPD